VRYRLTNQSLAFTKNKNVSLITDTTTKYLEDPGVDGRILSNMYQRNKIEERGLD
jgi:hypothetical protein